VGVTQNRSHLRDFASAVWIGRKGSWRSRVAMQMGRTSAPLLQGFTQLISFKPYIRKLFLSLALILRYGKVRREG